MDMRRLVGLNFARLRKEKGFTQERFAETSGFTQQYVSDLSETALGSLAIFINAAFASAGVR